MRFRKQILMGVTHHGVWVRDINVVARGIRCIDIIRVVSIVLSN